MCEELTHKYYQDNYTRHKELPQDVDPSLDTLTNKDIIEEMNQWLETANGISFCICIRNPESEHFIYKRQDQPCWGELRTHYDDLRKPSDLYYPFPYGTPVGIGINSNASYDWGFHDKEAFTEWINWSTSSFSPWTSGFKSPKILGTNLIICNTHIDPTVMVNMLLQLTHKSETIRHWYKLVTKWNFDPKDAFLLAYGIYNLSGDGSLSPIPHLSNTYSFWNSVDLRRWYNKNPRQLTEENKTLYQRGAYERPNNAAIFKGKWRIDRELKGINNIHEARELFDRLHKEFHYEGE